MIHREFNNRNARRNLSSFIPARNQNRRVQNMSLVEIASSITSVSELRKELILLNFYNDLIKGDLEKFSENIYIKRNVFCNYIYLISFKNNSINAALECDKYSYSETFKKIKPIYNIKNFTSIHCENKILEIEDFLLQGDIHFIGTLDILNLYNTSEESDPIFECLFDLDYEIRNLENSILYDNRD